MNISFEALLEKPLEVVLGRIYFIKENNEVNLYLGKSDKTLQYIGKQLGDSSVLPTELQGKSIMEMFAYLFQYANRNKNNLKVLVGNSIGIDYTTKTDEEISNDIINRKDLICKALSNKGVIATKSDELSVYAAKINSIVQNSQIKNTKLNIKKGETKQIALTNPTDIQNVCTSVLEYKADQDNVVKYDCGFNNGDFTSFDFVSDITFDGKMKQNNKIKEDAFIKIQENETFIESQYHINKSLFHTLDKIEPYEEGDIDKIKLTGTYFPTVVKASDDINLNGINKINKIIWVASDGDVSKNRLIFSLDSGLTWKSYDINNKTIIDININNLSEVENKGLTIEQVNSLTIEDLDILRDNSPKIRFGYYLEKNNAFDDLYNDNLSITVDMKGRDIPSLNYIWNFDEDGKTINYKFIEDGTYTIIYCDND
ncbi:TPA: hypothetical protein ACXDAY_002114 [Clostridium botulinum]|uniref:hypothetical protein n=3 Tax=Clostridium botulinum TaxID=1491 RepID=UPI0004633CF4|nr:hypothetical protein [Clostridium botulinum]APH20822.1 hypothetical protein NPD1_4254 [Clostridium botulinum]APQ71300.1 hypothetical protein RSJ8_4211 [Clostridium botulinum]APR02381.1 hypothetical protein RSJ2_4073 [Clostridium botulinum]AUN01588.1 hypothetical protein RSJ19_00995 [Clostridium botulinum]MBN3351919.1 hypothetical protein [Clostridium botulinum]